MKTTIILAIIFSGLLARYSYADQLEDAYRGKYQQLRDEIVYLNKVVSFYDGYFNEYESIQSRIDEVNLSYRQREISKKSWAEEELSLHKSKLDIQERGLEKLKELNKEHLSLVQMRQDNEDAKKRLKELDREMQDLKIKLLERYGQLPEWWTDPKAF